MTIPSTTEPAFVSPGPAQTGSSKGLAIAALVIGIVAFLIGFVPFAGIVVGAIGLILGIIALVKRQPKALALTGTILAAVGLITSLIASLIAGVFTAAVVEAVNETSNVTTEVAESGDGETADAEMGTRENPLPIGTVISGNDWDVTVVAFTSNVNDQVAAANTFNEPAPEGQQYAMIDLTATYNGADEGTSAFVAIDYVTSSGEIISAWDNFVVGMDPRFGSASLYAGGVDTGKLVFLIPSTADGVLRIAPGLFADDIFVAVN